MVRKTGGLAAVLALALAASSCGVGSGGETVEVVVPSAEGDAGAAPEAEGGSNEESGSGSSVVELPASSSDDENEASTDSEAFDLVRAMIQETSGRAIRGEFAFDGLLVSEMDASPDELRYPFEAAANGDVAIRLSPFFAASIHGGALPADTPVELRFVGAEAFLGVPAAAVERQGFEVAGDMAWMVIDPEEAGDYSAQCSVNPVDSLDAGSPEASSTGCDPLGEMSELLESMESAEVVGAEDVRGTPTTLVRISVPFAEASADGSAGLAGDAGTVGAELSAEDEFGEAFMQMFSEMDAGLAVELWIDDDRLLRRMAVDASSVLGVFAEMFGADSSGDAVLIRTVIDIHDYDDVTVETPPAESLVDELAELLRGASAASDDSDVPTTSTVAVAEPSDEASLGSPPTAVYENEPLCEAAGHIWDSTASECTLRPPDATTAE